VPNLRVKEVFMGSRIANLVGGGVESAGLPRGRVKRDTE